MIKVRLFKWLNTGLEVVDSFWNDQHAAIQHAKDSGLKAKVYDHHGELLHATEESHKTYA